MDLATVLLERIGIVIRATASASTTGATRCSEDTFAILLPETPRQRRVAR